MIEATKICTKCGIEKPLVDGFHSEKRNKNGRAARCRECSNKVSAAWKKAHPERAKELVLRWNEAHPERKRQHGTSWRIAHPEYAKGYYRANLDRARESMAKWREAHPEERRASHRKRKALKLAYDGTHHTASDVKALFEQQQGHCLYCYNRLDTYHVDHIVPLSRGGGNGADNIALACPSCNLSKNNKLLGLEWIPPYRADTSCSFAVSAVG